MKNLILLFFALSMFYSCKSQTKEEKIKNEINKLIKSIKENDKETFNELTINEKRAKEFLLQNKTDTISSLYSILNSDFLRSKYSLEFVRSRLLEPEYVTNIEKINAEFVLLYGTDRKARIHLYLSYGNDYFFRLKINYILLNGNFYFIIRGYKNGKIKYPFSELKASAKEKNLSRNTNYTFIDLKKSS